MKADGLSLLRWYRRKQARSVHVHGRSYAIRRASASLATSHREKKPDIPSKPRHAPAVQQRLDEFERAGMDCYPRLKRSGTIHNCGEFQELYHDVKATETRRDVRLTVHGRISSFRGAGNWLFFVDLVHDGVTVQGVCNIRQMTDGGPTPEEFKNFHHTIRRGDVISITGCPHRTERGELSVLATTLPTLLAPCLHPLPTELLDTETRMRNRHIDMLVNRRAADTLRLRAHLIRGLRTWFESEDFTEVQTPVLSCVAGGAAARPFQTRATEFSGKKLAMRIAPELWLKRLVLGGLDRVYEIGPCFRNEGIDQAHNPEYTSCEFYKAFADLEDLISQTERLFEMLLSYLRSPPTRFSPSSFPHLQRLQLRFPFRRVDFIPALESAIGRSLPDLSDAEAATSELMQLFAGLGHPLPSSPTLARLLDRLSSIYLEPFCIGPTFITHHPECLAPLAKSLPHPLPAHRHQRVSARFELFIHGGLELVNAYEEENSPLEQRRKMLRPPRSASSASSSASPSPSTFDENYLAALEWGLPPTGGWGCGIDRLTMFFADTRRIGDVLAFGTLKNVVGLASLGPQTGAAVAAETEVEAEGTGSECR
ncbi:MAG: hypothetical protein M1826_005170 [Phylliscum demangeonii]|nr:MAG: hypothetical protein M1826_005170 [Phylliscum demangeonii]